LFVFNARDRKANNRAWTTAIVSPFQWLIIHGRAVGKLLAPSDVLAIRRLVKPEQQLQPARCDASRVSSVGGALALRSLRPIAMRRMEDMVARFGMTRKARGDAAPHSGQEAGSPHSAIGRVNVNAPQSPHS
jgi:hypothetical protein